MQDTTHLGKCPVCSHPLLTFDYPTSGILRFHPCRCQAPWCSSMADANGNFIGGSAQASGTKTSLVLYPSSYPLVTS
jgi:hypothetical protein